MVVGEGIQVDGKEGWFNFWGFNTPTLRLPYDARRSKVLRIYVDHLGVFNLHRNIVTRISATAARMRGEDEVRIESRVVKARGKRAEGRGMGWG